MTLLTAATVISCVTYSIKTAENEHMIARNELSVNPPALIEPPSAEGYILSILSETDAAHFFAESELSSGSVQKRNFHLALESGVVVGASSVPAIYDAARNDILSGTYSYDLYAASGRELSRLLSKDLLDDISDNPYIDTDDEWFDATLTNALAVLGKHYFLSSSITDTYKDVYVLAYNPALCDENALIAAAKDGSLTLEKVLEYQKEGVSPIEIAEDDVFPLYNALGGSFANAAEELAITPFKEFESGITALTPFSSLESASFENGEVPFSVMTLEEVKRLKESSTDTGFLPLPKAEKTDSFRSYIDIKNAIFTALPKEHPELDIISYAVYRMAFLSHGYTLPSYYESLNATNNEMIEIIYENIVFDISALFGYGDIDALVADIYYGREKRPSLEYYNRRTLYEKAFEIIENRINKED
ncbi:MAG: hypothetical protein IIX18_00390 [Clostridia bacterium]|nr:hypothetical protein [Clostridia bacterium]